MSDPWSFVGEPAARSLDGVSVTLVEGACFSISLPSGDIEPGGASGLFFEDTRFVSLWRLRLDGALLQSLSVIGQRPFAATFLARGRPRPGQADSTLLIERTRYVGQGMREEIVLTNLGREPAAGSLTFELDADFAHLFEVKEDRIEVRGRHDVSVDGSTMSFAYEDRDVSRGLQVSFPAGARVTPRLAIVDVIIPAAGEWRTILQCRLSIDGEEVDLRYSEGTSVEQSAPVVRMRAWEEKTPEVRSGSDAVDRAFATSARDLGALRIFDPESSGDAVIAAGAPWFMTLFGRDSLIASLMTLDVDPSLALSTLRTLGRMQGEVVNGLTEEEPGKILHEVRRGLTTAAESRAGSVYYGSIDATPLFVVLLGEAFRWGLSDEALGALVPHADRALAWIEEFGDRDGDGFVEYQRATTRGLANQGWKDSFDGVSFSAGALAEAPIALCEVQGYVYQAYCARAEIAQHFGDAAIATDYERRAARLKVAFNEAFFLEDRGYFALGLDRDKRPIDALTSNIGHCLFTGIVDTDKAEETVAHLCGKEMFTGWGIRTLATSMARYNPVSYHNGSVWPHDSAICAAGLARYGFRSEAEAIAVGLFDASEVFGGRLPELFCGFDRDAYPIPVPYPSSCSPQAWASAAPYLLLRSVLLGLEPRIPDRELRCRPSVPELLGTLVVENLYLDGERLSITASGAIAKIEGLSERLTLLGDPAETA
jgi:glycogen debranching enzyme